MHSFCGNEFSPCKRFTSITWRTLLQMDFTGAWEIRDRSALRSAGHICLACFVQRSSFLSSSPMARILNNKLNYKKIREKTLGLFSTENRFKSYWRSERRYACGCARLSTSIKLTNASPSKNISIKLHATKFSTFATRFSHLLHDRDAVAFFQVCSSVSFFWIFACPTNYDCFGETLPNQTSMTRSKHNH